ncbi:MULTISPECIES: anti-sigma factor [Bacillus cereus group]|uniref:anti-sigma factor n=1 Tax=Bacillus cereus group TaxID=86661 RepID=UPI0001A09ACC|nr:MULTISPECIES: anti-sigma factor [Bacillus cereus group]EEL51806.1 Sigma-M negative effector [Bacillus cereus Rock3-44]PFA24724.1 sigma-M negative effector [Bacillus cereus]PFR24978.1 sigma-M negative effector [Bacillus cereus]PGZ18726.1 sigma-M negative effector [Bacillus cereus]
MTCMKCKELWEKYEHGTITTEEQEELENHIETCTICEAYLDELLAKTEKTKKKLPPISNVQVPFWKIKWKHRLQTLSFLLAVCMAIYMVGGILSTIYFQVNDEQNLKEVTDVPALALQATIPNSHIAGSGTNVEAFFRMHSDIHLAKTVGKKEFKLGTLQVDSFFSSVRIEKQWAEAAYEQNLFFAHPKLKQTDHFKETSPKVWEALQKVHEGTVAELAISFDKAYTLQELEPILYSVFEAQEMPPTPVWYALDTGVEGVNEDDFPLSNFGFPDFIGRLDVEEKKLKTKEDEVLEMMRILSNHEETVEKVTWLSKQELNMKKRYEYVKKNGVKVYGIVITGPSKELLKLQNSPHVRYATLGDIEPWNWFDRPISGYRH